MVRTDLSRWLSLAVLLFLGWIALMPLVAMGPAAHPVAIVITGLVFSAMTTTVLLRILSARTSVEGTTSTRDDRDDLVFAYSLAFRRLLRSSGVIFLVFFGLSAIGLIRGMGDGLWVFVIGLTFLGLAFLVCLIVLPRFADQVRLSDQGLDVDMIWGRPISIAWGDVVGLQVRSGRESRLRVETLSGIGVSVDSSLPGYPQLLSLIEERLAQRGRPSL